MQKNGRRSRPFFHVLVLTRTIETRCKQAYKPGSVLTAIYLDLPLPISSSHLLGTAGQASCSPTVLLRIEFTGPSCSQSAGELLPHLSTLTWPGARRYLSVALVLKSPSAGVTRYSCPMEPGLSSRAAFRPAPAAVQLACAFILLNSVSLVNRSSATSKSCLGPHDEWQSYKRPSS